MPKYTFTFKKNDMKLEYVTTDKESMERQFNIWVTCASVWAYNESKRNENANLENSIVSSSEAAINETEEERIERESQRIVQEYKAEIESEMNQNSMENVKNDFDNEEDFQQNQEKNEVNSDFQESDNFISDNNENEQSQENDNNSTAEDFDSILQKSISEPQNNVKEKQDERFIKVLNRKDVNDKLDLLITTAYYLSEYERLERFTLELVNAKLMENLHDVIDNSILQEAIDKGYIENIPNYTDVLSSTEYRLTEAGEMAFLNGRND